MSEQRDVVEDLEAVNQSRKYASERGPFAINANPAINQPYPREKVDGDLAAAVFAHEPLAQKFGEDAARRKIGEMVKAFMPGTTTTPLFDQPGPNGMSLAHIWFGPNFPLFRHSHPGLGDCLYYVVAGEIVMGKRRLAAGSTFFLPNGQPYRYTAGAAGVELLEFRAGGGVSGAPGLKLDETSLDSLQKIIDGSYENDHLWEAPERIGDTALRQARIDGRLD